MNVYSPSCGTGCGSAQSSRGSVASVVASMRDILSRSPYIDVEVPSIYSLNHGAANAISDAESAESTESVFFFADEVGCVDHCCLNVENGRTFIACCDPDMEEEECCQKYCKGGNCAPAPMELCEQPDGPRPGGGDLGGGDLGGGEGPGGEGLGSPTHACLVQRSCGPDVTDALKAVGRDVKRRFGLISHIAQKQACEALNTFDRNPEKGWGTEPSFSTAWEIHELHNARWVGQPPYYGCAIPNEFEGDIPPGLPGYCDISQLYELQIFGDLKCGRTVMVDGKCFMAAEVNYVLYGWVTRLCHEEFCCNNFMDVNHSWNIPAMLNSIRAYQLLAEIFLGRKTLGSQEAKLAWAATGWENMGGTWPSRANDKLFSTPKETKPDCPRCERLYQLQRRHAERRDLTYYWRYVTSPGNIWGIMPGSPDTDAHVKA